ncbi:MAG: hypothetical protein OXH15_06465 [Gammaproteobacteria bacterium]|nr:hypothetical protein [Gammaproteobacteria bacterium]
MSIGVGHHSLLLAAMADGVGDLTFASAEWVRHAGDALAVAVEKHGSGLADLDAFTFCEVAHNPPAYLAVGGPLAWHARFEGAEVTVATGELAANACDLKVEADHSIMSNLARLEYQGRNPVVVAAARQRLMKLTRIEMHGELPSHPVLGVVLRDLHDAMAPRTMPRFVFMTPEWVSSAREILTARATSAKYADGIKEVVYTFSEEFTDTPEYAFPDGSHGGFWVHVNHGQITVGAGPLPTEHEPADHLTKGVYTPVVPVGRTVNAAVTDADKAEQATYSKAAFRRDSASGAFPVQQTSPSGRGPMPDDLGRVFLPLHDELSKRTSGELPADFDESIRDEWATPQHFDRRPDYDPSWLNYDEVDIYGNARR